MKKQYYFVVGAVVSILLVANLFVALRVPNQGSTIQKTQLPATTTSSNRLDPDPDYEVDSSQAKQQKTQLRTTTTASSSSSSSSSNNNCLNSDDEIDTLVSLAKQVFILVPPKGGGHSLNPFARKCNKHTDDGSWRDNKTEFIMSSYEMPKVVSSHATNDAILLDLILQTPLDTLVIYVHRNENDRALSAMKHVIKGDGSPDTNRLCGRTFVNNRENSDSQLKHTKYNVTLDGQNDLRCTLDEGLVLEALKYRIDEISSSEQRILTCDTYDAIEHNRPNMIFVSSKQIDKLMKVLADNHCPELSNTSFHGNADEDKKKMEYRVKLNTKDPNVGRFVSLDDWIEKKGGLLSWATDLRDTVEKEKQCQGKTRKMEHELYSCPTEFLFA